MKVTVRKDRNLIIVNARNTQNENDVETIEITVPEEYEDFNKKIAFITDDGVVWDFIENNKYTLTNAITKYKKVKFYIWLTQDNKDFRSEERTIVFNKNQDANEEVTEEEISGFNKMINILEEEITEVTGLQEDLTNLINTVQTKLDNGDFVGPQGPQGEPGESYDDTEIKEEITHIKEEQLTQNTDIETLQTQVADLEEQVQELENNQLTGTATGQSIYIEDSTNTKVRSIGLSGNSEQESTTGKNLFDFKKASNIENTEITEYRIFEISGLKANQQYNINNMKFNAGLGNKYCYLWNAKTYSSTNKYEIAGTTNYNNKVDFNTNNEGKIYLAIYPTDTTTWENIISYLEKAQIEEGSTATTYEPFTGGQASPNPSYPQEIHSTGDSGSVNEKVQNKNLFDKINQFVNNWYNDQGIEQASTITGHFANNIKVSPNTQYVISGYKITNQNVANFSRIYFYDKNGNWISRSNNITTSNSYSFTTPINCEYINFQLYNNVADYPNEVYSKSLDTFMIEENPTATAYVAHEEQDISFPLAQGQKLMQGDYLADDGIHHVRKQIVLDGTELIQKYAEGTYSFSVFSNKLNNLKSVSSILDVILCNKLLHTSRENIWSKRNVAGYNLICQHNPEGNGGSVLIMANNYTEPNELKSYLAQQYANGTPVKVQYELATEVIDPYTEEQQAVWEQIKALRTYKPVTHISSTDEVPATLNVTYVKDLETVINNLGGA